MAERPVCDAEVRTRVTTDLGTTFLLEAGAGTGKTRVLVDRYVNCVLDPRLGTGDVRSVAAITFTEKAAGELRQRVREEFERLAVGAEDDPARAEVIRGALDALDDAPISTIHGFAGRLLREFPVEARVDPAFEQLDQLGSELERGRLWEEWLTELAAGDTAADVARTGLSRLLRAGVRLDWLRQLALGPRGVFNERYDLDPVAPPAGEPDLRSHLSGLAAPLEHLAAFCSTACSDANDRGCVSAAQLVDAGRALLEQPPDDVDQLAAALFSLPVKLTVSAPGGVKGNWDAAVGGKDELQTRYRDAVAVVTAAREAYAEFVTSLATSVADAFSRWAAAAQLAQGRLDFTDLLGCLRDLLTGDFAARAALQARFSYILVDEFQDTDPLQAEIVFLLCEQRPVARDWRDVVLQPGKLFVVGDPKQSIYRFRRADIGMYDQVRRLVDGQPGGTGTLEVIRQNFRTTPSVVNWVNNVFAGVFDEDKEEGRQPGYQWVRPYRPPVDGPRVAVLLGDDFGSAAGAADAARRAEGQALAALLLAMHGDDQDRWVVQDRDAGDDEAEAWRAPRWGDVAILFRATTGLETYEQAFREAGVPYRVDGGKAYFSRREVDDALLCLRAADDPSDGPAVYGALHSSLFGFSDDELFLFWSAGGRFDLFAEATAGHEAVAEALAVLRGLHERRAACEPHELAAELVRLVKASEVLAATGPGGSQAIANLQKLVDRARAFSGAGGMGLGAFLAWAAEAGDAAGEQESQVDDDGDVVHLLTIHKAKGLEYPIVILAGGALASGGAGAEPIVDREARRLAVKLKAELPGAPARDLEPQRYTALLTREKQMEASEGRRLLYVAATRARDRLVVTCFGKLRNKDGSASAVLLGPIADALPAPAPVVEEYEDGGVLVLPPRVPPPADDGDGRLDDEDLAGARRDWTGRRAELLARARQTAPATSPSGLEHVDEQVRTGGPGAPAGRARALALGSAVHRVMELCDLADEASLVRVAAAAAAELEWPELADEAAKLAAACWRAEPVRAAARAAAAAGPDAVQREVPVGALLDGVVVSGAVDLLFRDDGAWVVVDYKTDRAAQPEALLARYRPQGAAYAVAAEAALGEGSVREVCFIAARDGGRVVTVPVDDELRAEARREIAAAAETGRALRADELGEDPAPSTSTH